MNPIFFAIVFIAFLTVSSWAAIAYLFPKNNYRKFP
jgi:ABC-type transport system involved in cytochrome c biogenesis permease subunit